MATAVKLDLQERAAQRWLFLESHPDACGVVTRRMELVYLNALARTLVPQRWFGCRCWEAFPVADASCAARCPVIRAVRSSAAACYCEETVYPPGQSPLVLGVVVVPAFAMAANGEVLLVMRPKPAGASAEPIRQPLLAEAERLRARHPELTPAGGVTERMA